MTSPQTLHAPDAVIAMSDAYESVIPYLWIQNQSMNDWGYWMPYN